MRELVAPGPRCAGRAAGLDAVRTRQVQTIARIESGEPGVAIWLVLGMLALYGVSAKLQQPVGGQLE